MKKTYIIPSTQITILSGKEIILEGSSLHLDGDNITGSLYDDKTATSAGMTKSYSVWDEDWSAAE